MKKKLKLNSGIENWEFIEYISSSVFKSNIWIITYVMLIKLWVEIKDHQKWDCRIKLWIKIKFQNLY